MKQKILSLLLCACLVLAIVPAVTSAAETPTLRVPVSYALAEALGVDMQLLFDEKFVDSVSVDELSVALSGAYVEWKYEANKLNVAIASASPITTDEPLFYLNLTLKEEPGADDEVFKLLRVLVNEQPQDVDKSLVLLRGFADGGSYNTAVTPEFSQGTALLNGEPFTSGTKLTEEGVYRFAVTDELGNTRTVSFIIDKTAPVISIVDYDKEPTPGPVTVYATVNEGRLLVDHYVFAANGSFIFSAVDDAGNTASLEAKVDNIYRSFKMELLGLPEEVKAMEGHFPMTDGWQLKVTYDNGMERTVPVTQDMLSSSFEAPGMAQGIVTYRGRITTFDYEIISKDLATLVVTKMPDKVKYTPGQSFDPTGMELMLVLEDVYSGKVSLADCQFSAIRADNFGRQEITVTYGQYQATLTVTLRPPVPEQITSSKYPIADGYLTGVQAGTTVAQLLDTIALSEYVKVFSGDQEMSPDSVLATGMTIALMDEDTVKQTLTIVVTGDVNGDGELTALDLVRVRSAILGLCTLEGAQLLAADRNGDGEIRSYDYVQLVQLFTNSADLAKE